MMKAVMTPDNADLIILSDSMLMNRVQREAQAVAASFDLITRDAVAHIEEMYGLVAVLLYMGLNELTGPGDDLRRICAIVLTNALKSLSATFALVRTGWRLQPNICLRNGIEAASVVLHLIQHPEDLEKFKGGRLDSTKTLKAAKPALPVIGPLYGILNEEFVHVGKPFLQIQPELARHGSEPRRSRKCDSMATANQALPYPDYRNDISRASDRGDQAVHRVLRNLIRNRELRPRADLNAAQQIGGWTVCGVISIR